MSEYIVKRMELEHYEEMTTLWANTEGIGLSEADSELNIAKFLERNPKTCFICECDEKIIGTVLGGHDGRRGYIYHMCVAESFRNKGIGRALINESLRELKELGIDKCHLFVFQANELGRAFWESTGWMLRNDIVIMSKNI